jgi:heme/copper-type cytochrome/quinol oxidase subunit 2
MKVTFFENILYWLWLYSKRIKARFPFSFARAILGILLLSNLMSVVIILFLAYALIHNATEIPLIILNTQTVAIVFNLLFVTALFYILFRYRRKKYCMVRRQGVWVWLEKYCILADYFDNITAKQTQKHRKAFFLYLIVSIILATITLILFYYYMKHYNFTFSDNYINFLQ